MILNKTEKSFLKGKYFWQQRLSSIAALCPADTDAYASKSVLFTIFIPKFPQLKDKQDRCQKYKTKSQITVI